LLPSFRGHWVAKPNRVLPVNKEFNMSTGLLPKLGAVAAIAAAAFIVPVANAATILTFGQTGSSNEVTATTNGAHTQTTINVTNGAITVDDIAAGVTVPFSAFLDLTAVSTGAASTLGVFTTQDFGGSFSITSLAGGAGTNYLSGTFTDAVFGSGTSLTLSTSDPPNSVSFTSSVIPANQLTLPEGISLSFSNVTPPVSIIGQTVAGFHSNVSGNFSADPVPEPASIALIGVSLAGLGLVRRRHRA
jgi:hypothetical protein